MEINNVKEQEKRLESDTCFFHQIILKIKWPGRDKFEPVFGCLLPIKL